MHQRSHFKWKMAISFSAQSGSRFPSRHVLPNGLKLPNTIGHLHDGVILLQPFAVHYEKIRIHLREKATNSAKIHSLARKSEHLRVNQIQ